MDINHRVCFREESTPELFNYLSENNIPFEKGGFFSVLEILESNPHWKSIQTLVCKNSLLHQSNTIFSKSELDNAQWLTMRSCWYNGYPQPDLNDEYKSLTYNCDSYCAACGRGLVQIKTFRIYKSPNWRNRHFFMLNWVFDEIFVSEKVRDFFLTSDLSGFSFMEVLDKKGVNEMQGVYQLVIPTTLLKGLVSEISAIGDVYYCQQCSSYKYRPNGCGMLCFKKEIFQNAPDIVKTEEVFGSGHAANKKIIVSQKMYRFICDHNLGKNLCFEPIKLV